MLRLTANVRDAMVNRAKAGLPEEVCGVIAGDRAERSSDTPEVTDQHERSVERVDVATDVQSVPNVAETPRTRYSMEPEALLERIQSIESEGSDVIGFYHSHPRGPSNPSPTDHSRATWDDYLYVIVSLDNTVGKTDRDSDGSTPRITAWRWDATAEAFHEERVDTGDPAP